jgi:hypothetical protein
MNGTVLGIFMVVLCATTMASLNEDFNFCNPNLACEGACWALNLDVIQIRGNSDLLRGTCTNSTFNNMDMRVCRCTYGGKRLHDPLVARFQGVRIGGRRPMTQHFYSTPNAIYNPAFLNFCNSSQSTEICGFACSFPSRIGRVLGYCEKSTGTETPSSCTCRK